MPITTALDSCVLLSAYSPLLWVSADTCRDYRNTKRRVICFLQRLPRISMQKTPRCDVLVGTAGMEGSTERESAVEGGRDVQGKS